MDQGRGFDRTLLLPKEPGKGGRKNAEQIVTFRIHYPTVLRITITPSMSGDRRT